MERLDHHPILRSELGEWGWQHALLWAAHSRPWGAMARQVAAELERSAAAPPAPEAVKQTTRRFRREHRLISADEVRAWLTRHQLTVEEWMGAMERWAARDAAPVASGAGPAALAPEPAALAPEAARLCSAQLYAEAVCSGALSAAALALGLAAGVATRSPAPPEAPPPPDISGLPPADWAARAAELAPLHAAWRAHREREVPRRALLTRLAAAAMRWTEVDVSRLELKDEEAAREAALCLSVDELAVPVVAALAGIRARRTVTALDALPEEERSICLNAPVEQPMRSGRVVLVVHSRARPTLDDPAVRARLATEVRARRARAAMERHVRWLVEPQ